MSGQMAGMQVAMGEGRRSASTSPMEALIKAIQEEGGVVEEGGKPGGKTSTITHVITDDRDALALPSELGIKTVLVRMKRFYVH